jgi:putative heme iron utilization protein
MVGRLKKFRERPRGNKKRVMTPEERRHKAAAANKRLVCYRWSADIHNALVALEEQHFGKPLGRADGRLGLIVTTLLRFTLDLFEQGKLHHTPATKTTRMTSNWEVAE